MALTTPEATLWGAIIGVSGMLLGAVGKWFVGRTSAEESQASFWEAQATPLMRLVQQKDAQIALLEGRIQTLHDQIRELSLAAGQGPAAPKA